MNKAWNVFSKMSKMEMARKCSDSAPATFSKWPHQYRKIQAVKSINIKQDGKSMKSDSKAFRMFWPKSFYFRKKSGFYITWIRSKCIAQLENAIIKFPEKIVQKLMGRKKYQALSQYWPLPKNHFSFQNYFSSRKIGYEVDFPHHPQLLSIIKRLGFKVINLLPYFAKSRH